MEEEVIMDVADWGKGSSSDGLEHSITRASSGDGLEHSITRASSGDGLEHSITRASSGDGLEQSITRASSGDELEHSITRASSGDGLEHSITRASSIDGLELEHSKTASITGSDNLGGELLEGLDSYLEDINERLIVSRMVNDSVVKGMVYAIAQDAEERIKMKELEVAKLKESLSYYHMDEVVFDSNMLHQLGHSYDSHPRGSEFLVEHDRLRRSLEHLIASANDQILRLRNDINNMQGYVSQARIKSGTEIVGLNGTLHDHKDERWTDPDQALDFLKLIVENAFVNVDNIFHLFDTSLQEWKQDQHFREEIEAMVMRQGILSLKEKIVWGLQELDVNHGNNNVNWCDSIGELSRLRREFEVISKSLSISDNGLASHGSAELNEEWSNAKRPDVFHRNVKHDSQIIIPENLECAQFKHMPKDELFNYLKAEMIKMKRDHETEVHDMTEEYFSLKRRGPSMPSKKDKEFNALRKSIPEVIHKLDAILHKNENVTKLRNSVEGLDKLKGRLDNALSENHHLKGLLSNTQKEVKRLSGFAAEAQERMSAHSVTEMNLLKKIQDLNSTIRDMHTEAAIIEEIHNCILTEKNFIAKDRLKSQQIQSTKEQWACRCSVQKPEFRDSDFELLIMQELLSIILIETCKCSEESLLAMHAKSAKDSDVQISLQKTILEKEKALSLGVEEKQRLIQELNSWKEAINGKDQMILELTTALTTTKEDFDIVNEQLKYNTNALKLTVSNSSNEIMELKSKLAQAFEQNGLLQAQMDELNGKYKYMLEELSKINEERAVLLALGEDKQNALSLLVREKEEHRKQVELMHALILGLTREIGDFECRVAEDIEIKNSRLEDVRTQLSYLIKKSNIQRRTGLLYKQRLEKRCLDLQKAEAEVDLLGDEVDVLLNLLEKIYIALDHYSPILKHYPGIVEILKLVRRELSGESTKSHRKQFIKGQQKEYTKYIGGEENKGN
ncbi:unnamed protein product [Rhodiola kirilowii]